jgi:hypothetical protein
MTRSLSVAATVDTGRGAVVDVAPAAIAVASTRACHCASVSPAAAGSAVAAVAVWVRFDVVEAVFECSEQYPRREVRRAPQPSMTQVRFGVNTPLLARGRTRCVGVAPLELRRLWWGEEAVAAAPTSASPAAAAAAAEGLVLGLRPGSGPPPGGGLPFTTWFRTASLLLRRWRKAAGEKGFTGEVLAVVPGGAVETGSEEAEVEAPSRRSRRSMVGVWGLR